MKKRQLFSIGTNAKTVKGNKLGFLTGVMYLAPSDLSGFQVCPMAKIAGCVNGCLNTAGRGAFNSVQAARLAKTSRFFHDRQDFMLDLVKSIEFLQRKAAKENMIPLVRLNGTSDIRWEDIFFDCTFAFGKVRRVNIFEVFPDVQFYDYTKIANRKDIPSNYDLTFSYSGKAEFLPFVKIAMKAGLRIATVFRKREDIPSEFLGLPVIDGDDSDVRHVEPKNVIVALYAKGKAKRDVSGFVVDAPRKVIPILLAA
jgi:hypothetical protein